MVDVQMNSFFVGEKISKIRWVPEASQNERFLTGSWDMSKNFVRIWRLQGNEYGNTRNDFIPQCNDKVLLNGDITGLELLENNSVVASCSDGHISILEINCAVAEDTIQTLGRTVLLHRNKSGQSSPCTAISVYGKDIATVGEDGRLNIVDAGTLQLTYVSVNADNCALTAVSYVNPQEVLTANRLGVIRIFDVRTDNETSPIASFITSGEDGRHSNFVSCITAHPTQRHIVLSGCEEGSITIWDLRQPGVPTSYYSAHTSPVTEIFFQRADPSKMFTAAESGELWLWSKKDVRDTKTDPDHLVASNDNLWLGGEREKNRISVSSLISNLRKPINSLDSHGVKVICGSDTEAIFLFNDVS